MSFTRPPHYYLLTRAAIDEPHELGLPALARIAIHELRAGRDHSRPFLRALIAQTRACRPRDVEIMEGQEPGFVILNQEARAAAALEQQRQASLDRLRSNLTYVGTDAIPRTFSLLGWIDRRPDCPLCMGRDRGIVMLAAGIPGSGKTVLSTIVGEAGFVPGLPIASPILLPTSYVFFHLEENDRLPQLLDGLKPNPRPGDLELLMQRLGVGGRGLRRLRLVLPKWLMKRALLKRLRPYRDLGLEVVELRVHLGEIGQPGLEAALGAQTGTRFVQRLLEEAQNRGRGLRVAELRSFIESSKDLDANVKPKAQARLDVLEAIESEVDGPGIWRLFEPHWATVVYLGGPHMGHGRVSPILVSLLSGLMMHSPVHGEHQRVIAVDEVNLLDRDDPAWRMMVRAARLARHRGWTLILMGQDMLCAPDELFSVVGVCAAFRQSSPVAWDHLRHRIGALRGYRWEDVALLEPGEAVLAALLSTDGQQARMVQLRPPLCMHGGFTRGMI